MTLQQGDYNLRRHMPYGTIVFIEDMAQMRVATAADHFGAPHEKSVV